MKQTNNQSEVKEFYEQGGKNDPNFCNHNFKRLSLTRVLCSRCGLGFFDNPFDPFPVEEINRQTRKEVKENKELKNKKDVEITE
jgi:hypothetical protein